ncbi:MAG: hypothetical protein ACOYEV_18220 [Candidatus Nanopelagicales bacterium]
MVTGIFPRLALVAVSAVGLYIPTLGLPIPGSCMRTGSSASATPSPACASDLRDCLRVSAREGLYGVRFVTAEDVARCMEAFNACTHGTLQGGPNPPASTSSGSGAKSASLPKRFGINHGAGAISDCRVNGDAVTCTANWKTANDSYSAEFTGTSSGLTMAGTTTTHRIGHTPEDPGCTIDENYSGPVTYIFSPDGGVTFTAGPNQRQSTFSGSCSGSNSGMTDVMKGTANWTPTP